MQTHQVVGWHASAHMIYSTTSIRNLHMSWFHLPSNLPCVTFMHFDHAYKMTFHMQGLCTHTSVTSLGMIEFGYVYPKKT